MKYVYQLVREVPDIVSLPFNPFNPTAIDESNVQDNYKLVLCLISCFNIKFKSVNLMI